MISVLTRSREVTGCLCVSQYSPDYENLDVSTMFQLLGAESCLRS